ncbi:hypothetical protein VNO77_36255 [Canavalia gladiata]|uniref:Uncharacterized protein n=1 Tax=Canavalia gladiata TaxID=3824 RepID=A0AAN9KAX5_CANGL
MTIISHYLFCIGSVALHILKAGSETVISSAYGWRNIESTADVATSTGLWDLRISLFEVKVKPGLGFSESDPEMLHLSVPDSLKFSPDIFSLSLGYLEFYNWFNSYLAKEPQDAALLPPKHLPSLYVLQGSCYWRTAMTDFMVEKYSESFLLLSLDLLAFIPVPLYFFWELNQEPNLDDVNSREYECSFFLQRNIEPNLSEIDYGNVKVSSLFFLLPEGELSEILPMVKLLQSSESQNPPK